MANEFKLSASLKGHEDDVRAVTFATSTVLLSASRDATVRQWALKSQQPPIYDDTIVSHGQAFVNALAWLPPTSDFPQGTIISGGKDTIIELRQPGRPPDSDAERLLLGHQGNVCALATFQDGKKSYLVSGSWDASARIWDFEKAESIAVLEDHASSVWAVLAYDLHTVITGCADKIIRIYHTSGKLIREIKGSEDVVRALCKLSPNHPSGANFASAGNDAIIRLWTLEGKQIAQLHGHDSFIYSLTSLPNGDLASSGEDRTVRIWRNNQCVQTITHPAISVWSVAACPDTGDIATGASDRIVRIFSRSLDRHADSASLQAFDDSVKSSAIPQQQMGDINKEQLPGPEFLQQKSGTKDGQVQMIRESNGNISAHQWSQAAQQWMNVGTVVDAAGSSGRKLNYQGQDYDYVFDVDIEDGKPPLKLPYNLSENPFEVARKFIGVNELPVTYLDQVVNFITTNTQGATLGSQQTTSEPMPSSQARPKILPQKTYLTITTANFTIIRKKVEELNQLLLNEGRKDLSFSPSDIRVLPGLIATLEGAMDKPTAESPVMDIGANMVVKMITEWPSQHRIPAFDLFRCLTAANAAIVANHDVLTILQNADALPTKEPVENMNAFMLATRALANIFTHEAGRIYAAAHFQQIRQAIAIQLQSAAGIANRNVLIAAMTLYINYAVLFASSPFTPDVNTHIGTLLGDLTTLLANDKAIDSEALYRALVAAGTLLSSKRTDDILLAAIEKKGKSANEPRLKAVVAEIKELVS